MLKGFGKKPFPAPFAPKTQQRGKGYTPPGGRVSVPKRVPGKLRIGETRPAIYYKFDQVLELSDGSTVKRRSPFPRLEFKYLNDQRTNPIWNPSMPDLRAMELSATGNLAKFKRKFAGIDDDGPDESGTSIDDLMSADAEQVTLGKLVSTQKKKKK